MSIDTNLMGIDLRGQINFNPHQMYMSTKLVTAPLTYIYLLLVQEVQTIPVVPVAGLPILAVIASFCAVKCIELGVLVKQYLLLKLYRVRVYPISVLLQVFLFPEEPSAAIVSLVEREIYDGRVQYLQAPQPTPF